MARQVATGTKGTEAAAGAIHPAGRTCPTSRTNGEGTTATDVIGTTGTKYTIGTTGAARAAGTKYTADAKSATSTAYTA